MTDLSETTNRYFLTFIFRYKSSDFIYRKTLTESHQKLHNTIFNLKQQGLGYRKISQRLNEREIKSFTGKSFYPSLVNQIYKKIEKKPLLEEDLIRLCFADEPEIRKYLFDHVKADWLRSDLICEIYDKVYIHLHSENVPEAGIVMDELTDQSQRSKLAEIIFDLEKLAPTLASAHDCVKRLEEDWINLQLKTLRENLKNTESAKQDPISIMEKIDALQTQKKKLPHQNASSK